MFSKSGIRHPEFISGSIKILKQVQDSVNFTLKLLHTSRIKNGHKIYQEK
jgi:hypothetical protein